jgi:ribosome-associated protein
VAVLEIDDLVRLAAHAAADKKALDVTAVRVAELLVVTDYFLIATGANDRQVKGIADAIEDALRAEGSKPIGREGERELTWLLLDYGDFVVHVFQPAERAFYRLEKLWSDAPRLELPDDVVNASVPADAAETEADDRTAEGLETSEESLGVEEDGGS